MVGALDLPTSGTVEVDGLRVSEAGDRARYHREVVGFVFQHHHLLAHLSPPANVELPLIGAGVPRGERRARARELLDEVGMSHRAEAQIPHLSGGERQRVALARSLANDPRLLLADEPTGSLDTAATQRVLALVDASRQRRGMTMLIVTYDSAVAARADRVLHMRDGRLVPEDSEALRVTVQ